MCLYVFDVLRSERLNHATQKFWLSLMLSNFFKHFKHLTYMSVRPVHSSRPQVQSVLRSIFPATLLVIQQRLKSRNYPNINLTQRITSWSVCCREEWHVLAESIFGPQSLAELLPEQPRVLLGSLPAQVGLPLQQLFHAVVRRELIGWNVIQEHQDQNVLLFIKQTEARRRRKRSGGGRCFHSS